jgi:hypothetical protein
VSNPNCCGQKSKLVELSPRILYFYCQKCKNEVMDKQPAALTYGGVISNIGDLLDEYLAEINKHYNQSRLPGFAAVADDDEHDGGD